jgi:acyl carrier protein
MPTKEEIFIQVEKAVRTVLNTEEGEIKMETMFRADLDVESIDFLDIGFEIEKLTGVELDFPEVIQFLNEKRGAEITDFSISDLVDYLIDQGEVSCTK